jgi:hypothetical protein
MKIPKIHFRAVALITIIVSVIGLIASPVSAAAFPVSGDHAGASAGNTAYHHAFNSTMQSARLQMALTNLSQQGVDVSQAQADVTVGNMTAVFQWLMAYHKANPDIQLNGPRNHAFNSTAQTGRLQSVITTLGQSGVDVSQVQADIASGNLSAAMQWMATYHKAHPVQKGNGTTNRNGRNSTRWQQGGSFRSHHGEVFSNQTAQHSWHPAPGQGS